MVKTFALLVLLANLVVLNCQEEVIQLEQELKHDSSDTENPSYSFSYGVSDSRTGDIKAVWEKKEGDTVKGHYSVVEPDGSMRTVEYSAGPNSGFQAVVNNPGVPQSKSSQSFIEEKALKGYDHDFDFSEDADEEDIYESIHKKRGPHPISRFREAPMKKRPNYIPDQESSDYTHTYSIKHPFDESMSASESHFGYSTDANCKTKKKNKFANMYTSVADLELTKQKYPSFTDSFKDDFGKPDSLYDFEKYAPSYKLGIKGPKYDDDKMSLSSMKHNYPALPELNSQDSYYPAERPTQPKKKHKPFKTPEYFSDNLDDYILVPKKKLKNPTRFSEPNEYLPDIDDDFSSQYYNDDDRDKFRPSRLKPRPELFADQSAPKEIIRKIVKKKKPVMNILEMFDI